MTGTRYKLQILYQWGKRVKNKNEKVLGASSYACRSYRRKTSRGSFLPPLPIRSWIGLIERFQPNLRDWEISAWDFLFCKSCVQIITMNSQWSLALVRNPRSILTILPRYILPFCFRNLNSRNFLGDSLNVIFPQFSHCFLSFPLVFPHASRVVSMVSFGVSPISPQCLPCSLF